MLFNINIKDGSICVPESSLADNRFKNFLMTESDWTKSIFNHAPIKVLSMWSSDHLIEQQITDDEILDNMEPYSEDYKHILFVDYDYLFIGKVRKEYPHTVIGIHKLYDDFKDTLNATRLFRKLYHTPRHSGNNGVRKVIDEINDALHNDDVVENSLKFHIIDGFHLPTAVKQFSTFYYSNQDTYGYESVKKIALYYGMRYMRTLEALHV